MIISYRRTTSDRAPCSSPAKRESGCEGHARLPIGETRRWLVCLLVILLWMMTGCSATTSLATVSGEDEAIEILNVLHESGIDAHKEEGGEARSRILGAGHWSKFSQSIVDRAFDSVVGESLKSDSVARLVALGGLH